MQYLGLTLLLLVFTAGPTGLRSRLRRNATRRLKTLRRASIVDRIADGVWRVPPGLLIKIQQREQKDGICDRAAFVPVLRPGDHGRYLAGQAAAE